VLKGPQGRGRLLWMGCREGRGHVKMVDMKSLQVCWGLMERRVLLQRYWHPADTRSQVTLLLVLNLVCLKC
jgi:hypothetical protein